VTVSDSLDKVIDSGDVIIDFTFHEATVRHAEKAADKGRAMVIGTTGFSPEEYSRIEELSEKFPCVLAPNMSVGVNLLYKLLETAARVLGDDYDVEIVEAHHRMKKDAPSGTALTLAEFAAEGRGLDLDSVRVSGRDGQIGARSKEEIAVMALRGGDIVGRHTVGFYSDGEYLELNHTATSRETFSRGALRAAKWLSSREPGFYSINDALDL